MITIQPRWAAGRWGRAVCEHAGAEGACGPDRPTGRGIAHMDGSSYKCPEIGGLFMAMFRILPPPTPKVRSYLSLHHNPPEPDFQKK